MRGGGPTPSSTTQLGCGATQVDERPRRRTVDDDHGEEGPHDAQAPRYIVKSGDTLSAISIKTGVPLDTIQRLNPSVDAQTLHAGQRLKLAP